MAQHIAEGLLLALYEDLDNVLNDLAECLVGQRENIFLALEEIQDPTPAQIRALDESAETAVTALIGAALRGLPASAPKLPLIRKMMISSLLDAFALADAEMFTFTDEGRARYHADMPDSRVLVIRACDQWFELTGAWSDEPDVISF